MAQGTFGPGCVPGDVLRSGFGVGHAGRYVSCQRFKHSEVKVCGSIVCLWAGGGCALDGGEGGDGDAGGGVGAEGGITGVQGGAGRECVVHKEDVPGPGECLLGRFPVKPGMTEGIRPEVTEGIKQGMMEGIKQGTTENIRQGMMKGIKQEMTESIKPGTGRGIPVDGGKGDLEGGGDVAGLLLDGELGLGTGAAGPEKDVRTALNKGSKILSSTFGLLRMTNGIADCLGKDFGLVVAAGAAAGPVEGDGDDEIHIGKVRGRGEAAAQQTAEKTTGGQVTVVLQGARDGAVGTFVVHKGGGIGIVHALVGGSVALEDRVEAVSQRVMGR